MKLSPQLFDFRGSVVISDVYDDYQFRSKPKKIFAGTDLRNDNLKKRAAVHAFLKIRTVLGEQRKNIKEPVM